MSVWAWVRRIPKQLGLHTRHPSWQLSFVLLAFLLGIGIHSWIVTPLPFFPMLTAALGALTAAVFLLGHHRLALVAFMISACLFGLARYAVSFPSQGADSIAGAIGSEVRLDGTIVNDPSSAEERQEVILDYISVNDAPRQNKIVAYFARYPDLSYGWRLSFRCRLEEPKAIEGFDYPRYLLKDGIVAICFSGDEPMVVSRAADHPVRAVLYALRDTIEALFHRALPEPAASISAGLLLGIKTLPEKLDAIFRAVGVSHIFAASGSNVAMVLMVFASALSYVVRRQKAFWMLLLLTGVYVVLAGAEAAVVRAGIMAAAVLIATHTGRATTPRNLILLAAALMLAANPRLLRDDVGFQLSVLATSGMALLSKPVGERLEFLPQAFGVREALATTISASIFTLPIMILNFHQFSLVSPIANLLILPLVPYAMVFSTVAAALVAVVPAAGIAVGGLAWGVERLIVIIATALAAL